MHIDITNISLFHGLNHDIIKVFNKSFDKKEIEPGKIVIQENERSNHMFVTLSGELEAVKQGKKGNSFRIALFGPGDWFGETALIGVSLRFATIRATAPTLLMKITQEQINNWLFHKHPQAYGLLIRNIAQGLSKRLHTTDDILSNLTVTLGEQFVK